VAAALQAAHLVVIIIILFRIIMISIMRTSLRLTRFGHIAHYERQHRCQEDPVNSPSGGLEETSRTPPHHMAEHHTAGSEIPSSHSARSNDMAQNDVVDVWHFEILSCMPETTMTTIMCTEFGDPRFSHLGCTVWRAVYNTHHPFWQLVYKTFEREFEGRMGGRDELGFSQIYQISNKNVMDPLTAMQIPCVDEERFNCVRWLHKASKYFILAFVMQSWEILHMFQL